MGGRSFHAVSLLVVGLMALTAAACGSDDDGAAATTSSSPAPDVTTSPTSTERAPVTTTATPTTSPPVVTTMPASPTTTPVTTSTTTTVPTPVLPTWSSPMVLEDSSGGSPLTVLGRRARYVTSELGSVAVRPSASDGAEASTQMWFSDDALSWEPTERIEGERLNSIVAGGPGFIAVGAADSELPGLATSAGVLPRPIPVIWTSADGRAWDRATIDSTPFEFGGIDDVAVVDGGDGGDGGAIAVGEVWDDDHLRGPAVWTSPDGVTWTLQAGDPLGTRDEPISLAVAAGAGGVVVTGLEIPLDSDGPGPLAAWWSADGTDWERVSDIASFSDGSRPTGVVPFGQGFVMVGSRGAQVALVWTSADGRIWADPEPLPVRPVTDSTLVFGLVTDGAVLIAYGDDVVFGEGTDPAIGDVSIWMSLDAATWEQVPPESLRGADLTGQPSPVAVLQTDTGWIMLGSAFDPGTDAGVGVAWFGRTPA